MDRPVKVLFVCLHGAAKSVVAAKHLERLAAAESVDVESSSAGLEPDLTIPPHVVAGLAGDVRAVSDDYAPARDGIVTRLQGLLDDIRALGAPPRSR